MVTPASGCASRVSTRPRRTAARCGSIVPAATPVWIGLLPVYRKRVSLKVSLATDRSIGGATLLGSGGSCSVGSVVGVGDGGNVDVEVAVGDADGVGVSVAGGV